jgi:DNA polymerase III subunit epsilon
VREKCFSQIVLTRFPLNPWIFISENHKRGHPMKFVSLDFETANESLASVCQIGVASFADGQLMGTWETLVDPEDDFAGMNVAIHGITRKHVSDAPTFPEVFEELCKLVNNQVVVHHTGFDKVALAQSIDKYKLAAYATCDWLDTARVARRTWPECEKRGYGLASLARKLGIEFKHHSAVEDARAAGEIMIRAIAHTGTNLADWVVRVNLPIHPGSDSGRCSRDGNPEGILFGETIVFTGTLSLLRSQAADLAAQAGCDVGDNVTKKTTLLVVGDQDIRMLAGQEKSRKHRRAEELIAEGQTIRILTQTDFVRMVNLDRKSAIA